MAIPSTYSNPTCWLVCRFKIIIVFPLLNCSVYSGTVGGAREAFVNSVPSISVSYDWYVWIFDGYIAAL